MSAGLLSHHHAHGVSPVHRLPAAAKLGAGFTVILGTVLAPPAWTWWYVSVAGLLLLVAGLSRIPVGYLFRRLLALSPFVLAVVLVNAFQSADSSRATAVATKSVLCLLTVILVSNTTPFSQTLRVLKRAHVPGLLITTLALMHRYIFVLVDEAGRMRRARLSRTFTRGRRARWRAFSTVIGELFVRASERAERIYDAMCSRGWK